MRFRNLIYGVRSVRRLRCLPKVLSVVGQQVMTIQLALKGDNPRITFEGSDIIVKPGFGVFITMNPGYAGRYDFTHYHRFISTMTHSATTADSRLGSFMLIHKHPRVW